MREIIGEFLSSRGDFRIVGSAGTAAGAFAELGRTKVDLVLVDTALPDMSGIDLVRKLLRRDPATPCLMYSGHSEAAYVERAVAAGARGYVVKGNPRELPGAIRRVLGGDSYFSGPVEREERPC